MRRWMTNETTGTGKVDVSAENFLYSPDNVKRSDLLQIIPCATRISGIHEAFIPRDLRASEFNSVHSFARIERLVNVVGQMSVVMVPRFFRDYHCMRYADTTDGILALYEALFSQQGRSIFMQTRALLAQNHASGACMLHDDHETFLKLFRRYSAYHYNEISLSEKWLIDCAASFHARMSPCSILHENKIGSMKYNTDIFLDGMKSKTIPLLMSWMRVPYKQGEYSKWYGEFAIGICVLYCALSAMKLLCDVVAKLYEYDLKDIRRADKDSNVRGTVRNLLSHGATRFAYGQRDSDVPSNSDAMARRYSALDSMFEGIREIFLEHQTCVRIGNNAGIDIACAIVGIYTLLRAFEPTLEAVFNFFDKDEPHSMLAQASYEHHALGDFANKDRVHTLMKASRDEMFGERHLRFGESQEEANDSMLDALDKLLLIPMRDIYDNTVAVTSAEQQREIRQREDFESVAQIIDAAIHARNVQNAYVASSEDMFDAMREMFPQIDNVQRKRPHETIIESAYGNELTETANRLSMLGNLAQNEYPYSRELIAGLIGELTYTAPDVVDVVLTLMKLGTGQIRACRHEKFRATVSSVEIGALKEKAVAAIEKWLCAPSIMTNAGSSGIY